MSYFGPVDDKARRNAAVDGVHLKKDVGFGEAFSAQAQNTYGMFDENLLKSQANFDLGRFLIDQGADKFFTPEFVRENPNDTPFHALKAFEADGGEVPERFKFDTVEDFHAEALRLEGEKYKQRQEVLSRATGAGKVGGFLGGIVGSMDDVENIVTLPIGAAARAGIAMTAITEGVINSGIEGVAFGPRQRLLKNMGVESDETLLGAMGQGFVGGAVLGGAVRTLTGPEIYRGAQQLTGKAISALGVRKVAREFQADDNITVKIQGHAIEDELNYKQALKDAVEPLRLELEQRIDIPAERLAGERALQEDADFLRSFGDFEGTVERVSQAIDEGRLIDVPVLRSDGVTEQVRVAEGAVRAARLLERYEIGEAIPAAERDALGVPVENTSTIRNVVEYFDEMDARFAGQRIPDEFDPVDDLDPETGGIAPEVKAAIEARRDDMQKRQARADDLEKRNLTPEDFGANLSRMAREEMAVGKEKTALQAAQERDVEAVLADIDTLTVGTKNGAPDMIAKAEIIAELEKDLDFAEQIKLCGLK